MEPLQQQQKQPHQAPLQMDAREKQNLQTREAQLLYAPKLSTQPTLLSVTPGRPSGSPVLGSLARVTPATPVTQVFEQSSINSEPEEEEGGLEDEDGDDNVTEVAEKEAQAASKYFHVQKASRQDARAAPMSSLLPAPGLPLQGQQAKEDHTKDTSKAPPPIPTAGQSSWNLDEQLKQNGALTWSDDADGGRGREISRDFAKVCNIFVIKIEAVLQWAVSFPYTQRCEWQMSHICSYSDVCRSSGVTPAVRWDVSLWFSLGVWPAAV